MELRRKIRRPARYIEDEIPELPGRPQFVHPTVPYNERLPEAAFPTLDAPTPLTPGQSPLNNAPQIPRPAFKLKEPPRRAVIFRGPRNISKNNLSKKGSHVSKPDEVCRSSGLVISPQKRMEDLQDPGQFVSYGYFSEGDGDQKKPRAQLGAFKRLLEWSALSDGIKIIIFGELMQRHSFENAVRLLDLTEDQTNKVGELINGEIEREIIEKENIDRCLSRQLSILMSGAAKARSEAYSKIIEEELYANIQDPVSFMVSKEDVLRARHFLRRSGENELIKLAESMWKYFGVGSFPNLLAAEEEPDKELEIQHVESDDESDVDLEPQIGDKRKREASTPTLKDSFPDIMIEKSSLQRMRSKRPCIRRNPESPKSGETNEVALASNLQHSPSPKPTVLRRGVGRPRKNKDLPEVQPRGGELKNSLTTISPTEDIVIDRDRLSAAANLSITSNAGINQRMHKATPVATLDNPNQRRTVLRKDLDRGGETNGKSNNVDNAIELSKGTRATGETFTKLKIRDHEKLRNQYRMGSQPRYLKAWLP